MNSRIRLIGILVTALAAQLVPVFSSAIGLAQAPTLDPNLGAAQFRYRTQIKVSAQAAPVEVVAHDWLIPHHRRIERLPEEGMLVVELRGGPSMTTIIDGKSQKRREGEVWLVPARSSMGIETDRYSATLHIVAFRVAGAVRPAAPK
jgi:hypothetical protein